MPGTRPSRPVGSRFWIPRPRRGGCGNPILSHFAPNAARQSLRSREGGLLFDRTIPLPSSGPWDEKDLIGNPPLPMFVEVVGSLATIMDICGSRDRHLAGGAADASSAAARSGSRKVLSRSGWCSTDRKRLQKNDDGRRRATVVPRSLVQGSAQ